MDTFMQLKTRFTIKDTEYEEIQEDIQEMTVKLEERNIKFTGDYKIGFYSHMISLIRRMKEREPMIEIGDEVLRELDEEIIETSKQVLTPLFHKYQLPIDRSEVLLVAIHLQTAKNNKKGGENVGK